MTQPASPPAPLPTRFRALDAWRGICAALVVLFHVPVLHIAKDWPAFANLQLGVDFFFVLSGFVISHAYQERLSSADQARGFLVARFRRLWPLHVAVLAAFVVLAVAAPAGVLAEVPLAARVAGLAAGLLGYWALRGRLLPALLCGLAALAAVRALLGG